MYCLIVSQSFFILLSDYKKGKKSPEKGKVFLLKTRHIDIKEQYINYINLIGFAALAAK